MYRAISHILCAPIIDSGICDAVMSPHGPLDYAKVKVTLDILKGVKCLSNT